MSLYSSYGEYGNAASPKPSADAWVIFEEVSGSNPVIIDSSGVSSVSRVQAGVRRVNFSNPERFGNGAFAAIATQEIGDGSIYGQSDGYAKFPALCVPHGITSVDIANPPYSGGGASASCDVMIIGFKNAQNGPSALTDTSTSYKVRTNIAFFCLRSDTDTNKTAVANLLINSENFNLWANNGSVAGSISKSSTILSPFGGASATNYNSNASDPSSNYVAQIATKDGVHRKTYTFSVYARAGAGLTATLMCGGVGSNFGFDYNLSTSAVTLYPNSGPFSQGATCSGRMVDVGGGWKRCILIYIPTTGGLSVPLIWNYQGTANKNYYVWGAQLEEGTVATDYIKTESTAPVYGNQDLLINQYPGIQGFGASGATFNSSLNQQITKRQATAWGTIVIPGISGSNIIPPAYLEAAYGVNNLVVGTTAGYDVYFTNEMGNTGYCVVASLEQENVYETESTTRGAATSIPPSDEFAMLVLNSNAGQTDTQRTKQNFTLRCFRQNSSDYFFSERNIHCNRGRTQRIHFMVFGGKSSYAAS